MRPHLDRTGIGGGTGEKKKTGVNKLSIDEIKDSNKKVKQDWGPGLGGVFQCALPDEKDREKKCNRTYL